MASLHPTGACAIHHILMQKYEKCTEMIYSFGKPAVKVHFVQWPTKAQGFKTHNLLAKNHIPSQIMGNPFCTLDYYEFENKNNSEK